MTDAAKPEQKPEAPAAPLTEQQRQDAARAVAQKHREQVAAAGAPEPAAAAPAPKVHEKPEGVPDKFFNKDTGVVDYKAWGEAHKNLETKFHQAPKPEQTPPTQPDPVKTAADAAKAAADAAAAETDPTKKAALEEAAKKAKADADKAAADAEVAKADASKNAVTNAQAEFAKDGKLSDASYKALEAAGYTRDMVDTYIAGQQSKVSQLHNAAYEGAEGEANYNAMLKWAETNLTPAEIAAYDAQVGTNDPAVIKVAAAGLYARYKAVAPVEGHRVAGGNAPAESNMYRSKAEMMAGVNNPLYKTDAAFRAQHQKKMDAARNAGINLFI